jgi:hypothetical protein
LVIGVMIPNQPQRKPPSSVIPLWTTRQTRRAPEGTTPCQWSCGDECAYALHSPFHPYLKTTCRVLTSPKHQPPPFSISRMKFLWEQPGQHAAKFKACGTAPSCQLTTNCSRRLCRS